MAAVVNHLHFKALVVIDRIATEVGSPWMREHVVPLLDGPPQRHIGPSLASSMPLVEE
jgi:hypothetical protein